MLDTRLLPRPAPSPFPGCSLLGLDVAAVTESQLLDHMFEQLDVGRGGWLLTANADILRRYVSDRQYQELYEGADICVADGMPLVWAARLAGERLPMRVSGASLVPLIAGRAAAAGRSVYLLGGDEGAAEGCKAELERRYPGLHIGGLSSPWLDSPPTEGQIAPVLQDLRALEPHILLVAMGSPKQEQIIAALRPHLPSVWMAGVGISFSFIAGLMPRAPTWMQRSGLEWLHRLAQEPGRLARRYLIDDLPFVVRLFASCLKARFPSRSCLKARFFR